MEPLTLALTLAGLARTGAGIQSSARRTAHPPAAWGRRPGARGVIAGGVGRTKIGRPAMGDELTEAAEAEREAAATRINRELTSALMRTDLEYGALGTFESGARMEAREEQRQAAIRDLGASFAGIELERLGIEQRGEAAERSIALQEAQLKMQADAARSQMYGQMAAASVPLLMEYVVPFVMDRFGGGEAPVPGGSTGLTKEWGAYRDVGHFPTYKGGETNLATFWEAEKDWPFRRE